MGSYPWYRSRFDITVNIVLHDVTTIGYELLLVFIITGVNTRLKNIQYRNYKKANQVVVHGVEQNDARRFVVKHHSPDVTDCSR